MLFDKKYSTSVVHKCVIYFAFMINFDFHSVFCEDPPNFIIIYADDVGYGDLYSYGHPTQEKGPIDQMVDEGMKFTQWYSPASLCTPSRASLLTGNNCTCC